MKNKPSKTARKSLRARQVLAELKDKYIELLQEGYKPEEVEKFIQEIQEDPTIQEPRPTGSTIASDLAYLANEITASDADNFKGSGVNKGCKNPKANENLEELKKNTFDRKKSGFYIQNLKYLRGE